MNKKRNWKTTLLGYLILATTGLQIAQNPQKVLEQSTFETIVGGLAGVGLIQAADSKKEEK